MKNKLLFISMLLFSFVSLAQIKAPQEVHVIGEFNYHYEQGVMIATVFDERTRIVYQFPLPEGNKCNGLVEDKYYEFKLLATCDSSDCYGLNYTYVTSSLTLKQVNADLMKLRVGTVTRFEPNKRN